MAKLTSARIKAWRQSEETSARLKRQKAGAAPAKRIAIDPSDAEVVRSRKATSNRVLTILKAALNHAFAENKVASDQERRQVRAHREVDVPLVRFLSDGECRRLVAATEGSFRDLVCGALVTGARYGELSRMRVADYNPASGFVTGGFQKQANPATLLSTRKVRSFSRRLHEIAAPSSSSSVAVFAVMKKHGRQANSSDQLRRLRSGQILLHPQASMRCGTPTHLRWR